MLKSQNIVYKCLELRQVFFRMTYLFVLLVMVYLAHVDGQTTMYVVVTSGTCQSNGHNMISESDKCEAAASRVGWPDTTVNAGQWTSYPTGCVTSMSNSGSKQLHYNTLSWASPSCSISTNVKGCLCEYTGAACAYGAGVTANPDTCACGLSVCTSTTGFFCTTSLSSCSTSAACAITDGSALNTEKCSCGTADCEDSSLCFADENRCAIPNCAIIDGSAENLATCACGSATCTSSTGLFCDASKNSCSKVVGSHTDVYLIVTSGTCQSNGYNLIPDAATCGLAAAAVGWSDTSVNWPFSYFRDNFPGGCLDFHSAVTGGDLKFNTFYGGGGSCNDGSSKACLCSITVPTCPIADGSVANVDSCLCGNTICNEGAGLYCDAATSKCKPYPIVSCSNIDATESNAANCVCGSTDCDEASGLFCDASRNSCHIVPLCTNTVGIVANTASCACGTVNCDAGTGLYCSTALNQCSLTNYFSKGGIEAEICVEQNGLVINNQPCFCGSNTQYCTLTTGLVCDGSSSTCNMIPACANTNGMVANIDSAASRYKYVFDPQEHCERITTLQECADAALYLGGSGFLTWPIEDVMPGVQGYFPLGCFRTQEDAGSNLADVFLLNTNPTAYGPHEFPDCGSVSDSDGEELRNTPCVCKDEPSCSCGTATCDADSGFCDISKNQCDSLPYCVNTDGRLPNTGDCKCNTTTVASVETTIATYSPADANMVSSSSQHHSGSYPAGQLDEDNTWIVGKTWDPAPVFPTPTDTRALPNNYHGSGCTSSNKCGVCAGDCDIDAHCQTGLKCEQAPGYDAGATHTRLAQCGGGSGSSRGGGGLGDYCYDPTQLVPTDWIYSRHENDGTGFAHLGAYGGWYQIELPSEQTVVGTTTQGRHGASQQWVTSWTFKSSTGVPQLVKSGYECDSSDTSLFSSAPNLVNLVVPSTARAGQWGPAGCLPGQAVDGDYRNYYRNGCGFFNAGYFWTAEKNWWGVQLASKQTNIKVRMYTRDIGHDGTWGRDQFDVFLTNVELTGSGTDFNNQGFSSNPSTANNPSDDWDDSIGAYTCRLSVSAATASVPYYDVECSVDTPADWLYIRASGTPTDSQGRKASSFAEIEVYPTDLKQCADACIADATCQFFVLGTGSNAGKCYEEHATPGIGKHVISTCSASSKFGNTDTYACAKAFDGSMSTDWAIQGSIDPPVGSWIQLNFAEAVSISRMKFANRVGSGERSEDVELEFSDGQTTTVTLLNNDNLNTFDLGATFVTTSVKITIQAVHGGVVGTPNNGAKEIEFWGPTPCTEGWLGPKEYDFYEIEWTDVSRSESDYINGDARLRGDDPLDWSVPEVYQDGEWYPICGHFFWNNDNGAETICKWLGYAGGTQRNSGGVLEKDAIEVGACNAGERMHACTGGGNSYNVINPSNPTWCEAGNQVKVEVKCHTYIDTTEQDLDPCSITDAGAWQAAVDSCAARDLQLCTEQQYIDAYTANPKQTTGSQQYAYTSTTDRCPAGQHVLMDGQTGQTWTGKSSTVAGCHNNLGCWPNRYFRCCNRAGPVQRLFPGNSDQTTKVDQTFATPVTAKYIRFYPQSNYGYTSARMGVRTSTATNTTTTITTTCNNSSPYCLLENGQCANRVIPECTIADGTAVNEDNCACGENDCTGLTGLFCDTNNNDRCTPIEACVITNGTAANPTTCACGANDCNSLTGLFCDRANDDSCTPIEACAITDGTAANPATCACGENVCDGEQLHCIKAENKCSLYPNCLITDGSDVNVSPCMCGLEPCKNHDIVQISDGECNPSSRVSCEYECRTIAKSLQLQFSSLGSISQDAPSGCYIYKNEVSFNPSTSALGACSNTYECICRNQGLVCSQGTCLRAPLCEHIDGVTLNEGPCACGLTDCSSASGFVCDFKNNECMHQVPTCVQQEPFVNNTVDCLCGDALCTETNGRFCLMDDNTCFKESQCHYRNGIVENSHACGCGDTRCTADTGLFCQSEWSTCSTLNACVNRNGSEPISNACACGQSECAVGQYCNRGLCQNIRDDGCKNINAVNETQPFLPICAITNGTMANSQTCRCGNTTCDQVYGLYCIAEMSQCSLTSSFFATADEDVLQTSTYADSIGKQCVEHIHTFEQCVFASQILGITHWNSSTYDFIVPQGSFEVDDYTRPAGCFHYIEQTNTRTQHRRESLYFNRYGLNEYETNDILHRYIETSFTRNASSGICFRPQLYPSCPKQSGYHDFALNDIDKCVCGAEVCAWDNNKMVCDEGQCIRPPPCENTIGTIENTGVTACSCGETHCMNKDRHGTDIFEPRAYDGFYCRPNSVGPYHLADRCDVHTVCEEFYGLDSTNYTCMCAAETCVGGEYCALGQCISYGGNVNSGVWSDGELEPTGTVAPLCVHNGSVPCLCGASYTECAPTIRLRPETLNFSAAGTGLACMFEESTCGRPSECVNDNGTVVNDADTCACGNVDCWASGMYCFKDRHMCKPEPLCTKRHGAQSVSESCTCQHEICSPGQYCYENDVTYENYMFYLARNSVPACRNMPTCADTSGTVANDACYCEFDACDDNAYCYQGKCWQYPLCLHTEGRTENTGDCICGQNECTGEFDYCYQGKCLRYPLCEHSDGVGRNDINCTCGQHECEKPYCHGYLNHFCSENAQCVHEDGSTPNDNACLCNITTQSGFVRHKTNMLGPVDNHYFDTCTAEQFCQNTQDGHGRCDDHPDTVPANIDTGYIYLPECELGPRILQNCVCEYESVCAENNYCVVFDDIKKCVANPECEDKTRFFATEASCMCAHDTTCQPGQFCDAGICYDVGYCEYFAAQTFTDRECSCADKFGSFDETCAVGEACLKDQRCGAEIDAEKCGCVDRTVSRCEKLEGREPNNIGSFVLCTCGQAVCQFNEYCNADESRCSATPIVSCPVGDTQVVSPCQCVDQQCVPGQYCDRSVLEGRCTTESCSRFQAREPALCAFEGHGNGVYTDRYCQGACDADTDQTHCCMPCLTEYNVFTSTCESPCPTGLCIGDEWLEPPSGVDMAAIRSQYNPRYSGFGTTPTTCCVPNPTCQGRIVTDFNCDEAPAYTGRYFDKYCDTYTCDHTMCCEESICTCEHGTAAIGLACAVNGTKHCVACADTHYLHGSGCVLATVCNATEYQTVDKTTTTDRQCAAQTVCSSDQFEIQPPTTTSDRQCAPLGACNDSQYESVPQTAASDRQCTSLTVCNASQYESVARTATSDRQCSPQAGQCQPDEYEQVVGDATTLRICQPLTVCGDGHWAEPPTTTTDRQCYPWTVCNATEFEQTAPSMVQDRVCQPWTICSSEEFEAQAPNATVDRICQPRTRCQPHEFVQHNGTEYADVQCARLTLCSATEYETVVASQYSDRVCTECDFEGCIGCRTTYDCAYDTRAKIQNRSACAGIRCERILLASLANAQLHTGHAYRVEGDAIADLILDTPDLTQVRTDTYLYFAIESEYEGDIVYDGQTLQLQRDCVYNARWEPCRDNKQQGCTGVQQGRVDAIVRQPVLGGDACPEVGDVLSRTCEIEQCDIDCVVEWTAWSTCPANCGETGIHYRNATVLVQSAYRGQACPPLFETRTCVTPPKSHECACGRTLDGCGVCGGDNATCADCSGALYGRLRVDRCGVCGGDGSTCGMLRETRSAWHEATDTLRPWVPWVVVFVLMAIIVPTVIHCTTSTGRKKRKL